MLVLGDALKDLSLLLKLVKLNRERNAPLTLSERYVIGPLKPLYILISDRV